MVLNFNLSKIVMSTNFKLFCHLWNWFNSCSFSDL